MDIMSWIREIEELDLLYLQEEMRDMENQQTNDQQPYLGQRCAVTLPTWEGFGTIVDLKYDQGKQWVRVELDAQASQWYEIDQLELLPTYPAV